MNYTITKIQEVFKIAVSLVEELKKMSNSRKKTSIGGNDQFVKVKKRISEFIIVVIVIFVNNFYILIHEQRTVSAFNGIQQSLEYG